MNEGSRVSRQEIMEHAVVLPCEPGQFKEFISGLLGRPQRIRRRIIGNFEVSKENIANICHLIDQRIESQNDSSLISIIIRIDYSDNSSVELNSLDDFISYSEIKPLMTKGIYISLIYLINFRNRAPEKQEIEIVFKKINYSESVTAIGPRSDKIIERFNNPGISVRINHTDRTWGTDIDNLLNEHLKMLIHDDAGIKRIISENSGKIGFISGSTFMMLSLYSVYSVTNKMIAEYLQKAKSAAHIDSENLNSAISKIDFMIEIIASGMWTRYAFYTTIFLIISIILSCVFGALISSASESNRQSIFFITDRDRIHKKAIEKMMESNWIFFCLSTVGALVTGVAGNYLFAKLTQWFQI